MKKKTKLMIAVSVIIIVALLVSVSSIYNKGPWRGKVIDSETKQPIEGAAVVAVWSYYHIAPTGRATRFLDAEETVTDKNGEFVIPAKWYLQIKYLRTMEEWKPTFTIYKPGYGTFPGFQISPMEHPSSIFEGDGAVVELPTLETKEERLRAIPSVSAPWQKIPEMLRLINSEYEHFGYGPVGPKGE